jgi:hypothetical protein
MDFVLMPGRNGLLLTMSMIELVLFFIHRILRCHVLIDLKVRKFTHGDTGQMNFYLNYYRENIMLEGDNPPVGLILCTDRDETVEKYATTGMDNNLFVAKYLTQLHPRIRSGIFSQVVESRSF